jgi:hypothetical protein
MSGWVALAIVPSLLVSLPLAYVLRALAPRWGLVDRPGQRKVHHTPVPYGGGLAIWAGVVLPLGAGQLALEFWYRARLAEGSHATLDWSRFGAWPAALGDFISPHLPGLVAQELLAAHPLVLQLAAQGGGCRQRLAFAIVDDLGIDMFATAEDREAEPLPAADFFLDPLFPFPPRRFLGTPGTILL